MDQPSSQPRRRGNLKRNRASESGNTATANNPVQVQVPVPVQVQVDQTGGHGHALYGAGPPAFAATAHSHRANGDDTVQTPTFPSQQLDVTRPHHLGDTDGLMNGYSAPHTQYPEPAAQVAVAADVTGVTGLNVINNGLNGPHHQHQVQHAHQHHPPPPQKPQQNTQSQQTPQQRSSASNANKNGRSTSSLFQEYAANNNNSNNNAGLGVAESPAGAAATAAAAVANIAPATPSAVYNLQAQGWGATPSAMSQGSPGPATLQPPPEGIYRSFEDLLSSVQKLAKDQGYGVVKLRASNYRDGKPTRYDLVCDRGGVKYSSTAKKRNPSTRKVDCPWRAKAVCEVQLGNQWRFAVQEARHNHEPRVAAAPPGQENTPVAQSIRSLTNKMDRMQHDMSQGFQRLETLMSQFTQRVEGVEKRMEVLENSGPRAPPQMLPSNAHANLGTPSMPTANMGGPGMGNGGLGNGGMGNGGMGNGGMGNGGMGNGGMGSSGMGNGGMGNGGMGNGGMGNGGMTNGGMGNGSMGNGSMGNGSMGNGSMGNGSMGSGPMGNGPMGNGMVDSRLQHIEARVNAMEQRQASMVDGMSMMDDESSRLLMVST